MAKVQFVTSVKYRKVMYPSHTPFEVNDADVESLVKSGAIVIESPKQTDNACADKSLSGMKVDELKAYAEAHNIDISKAEKKSDIIAIIEAAKSE